MAGLGLFWAGVRPCGDAACCTRIFGRGRFQWAETSHEHTALAGVLGFAGRIGIGVAGGAIGIAGLWLLTKLKLSGILAVEAIFATVIVMAGLCDAIQDDTGLVAAITMGIGIANWPGSTCPGTARC
jgi:hypothetical protein